MQIISINSVIADVDPDTYIVNLVMDLDDGAGPFDAEYGLTPGDIEPFAQTVRDAVNAWLAAGNPLTPYTPPPVEPRRRGEFREFMALFTPDEQVALKQAERTDDQVALWIDRARGGATLSLDHSDTAAGLSYAVALGLITSDRAAQILASDFDA